MKTLTASAVPWVSAGTVVNRRGSWVGVVPVQKTGSIRSGRGGESSLHMTEMPTGTGWPAFTASAWTEPEQSPGRNPSAWGAGDDPLQITGTGRSPDADGFHDQPPW